MESVAWRGRWKYGTGWKPVWSCEGHAGELPRARRVRGLLTAGNSPTAQAPGPAPRGPLPFPVAPAPRAALPWLIGFWRGHAPDQDHLERDEGASSLRCDPTTKKHLRSSRP